MLRYESTNMFTLLVRRWSEAQAYDWMMIDRSICLIPDMNKIRAADF